MNTFRKIVSILLVIIFISSIIFNILIYSTSYGTLIFKYDDSKFSYMVDIKKTETMPTYFLYQKNQSIQIYKETSTETTTIKNSYIIDFDKDSNLIVKIIDSNQTNDIFTKTESYYINGYVYKIEGDNKIKTESAKETILNDILTELYIYQQTLSSDILVSKTKAKPEISMSPFYLLGLKYAIKEDNHNITYSYDLKGDLRKIKIKDASSTNTLYTINYKNKKLTLPNLEEFN